MADDDLETGRPRDSTRKSLGNSPLGPSQAITLVMSMMLVGLLVCTPMQGQDNLRMLSLAHPIETAQRVFERNLWIQDAVDSTPTPRRELVTLMLGHSDPARESALAAFDDLVRKNGYPRPSLDGEMKAPDESTLAGLRARRAVLLLDAGRTEEAEADLARLSTTGHAAFVESLRRAFKMGRLDDSKKYEAYDTSLAGEDWIGTSLRMRLARATGDAVRLEELASSANARLASLSGRVVLIAGAQALVLLLGLLAIGVWLARNRPALAKGSADIPPAWTFEAGYATAVRAAFAAIAIWFVVSQIEALGGEDFAKFGGGVLAAVPLIWLIRRRLLRPLGTTFRSAFGLTPSGRPLGWMLVACAIISVQWLGSELLVNGMHALGAQSHWTESLQASGLSESPISAPFEFAILGIAAPFFVELGVRGLLFLTLRRHYGAWHAALFSSLLFSAAQFQSLPGLAASTWEGFVLAMAFEMSRTLVPNIAAQIVSNALALAALWAFWR